MERPVLRRPLESDLLIELVGEEVFLCPRMLKKWRGKGGQTALRARAARTIRMCSLDARSKGQSGHPSKLDLERAWEASTEGTIASTSENGLIGGLVGCLHEVL